MITSFWKKTLLRYRQPLVILAHLGLIIISYLSSFYIRFEFTFPPEYYPVVLKTIPIIIFIKLLIYYLSGIYSGLWRYVSLWDIWKIIFANFISALLIWGGVFFYHGFYGFPRSVIIIDLIISIAIMSGARLIVRTLKRFIISDKETPYPLNNAIGKRKKALIIGAGDAGVMILRECKNNPNINMEVVGFIDDDPSKKGHTIYGCKIFGPRQMIPEVATDYEVDEIIIAIPSAKGETIREILSYCSNISATIKIMPRIDKLISGHVEIKPRAIKPEDLLGRPSITVNMEEISGYIKGKTILVTGAGGSIGSEICRQLAGFSPERIIFWDNHENYVYYLGVEFNIKYPSVKYNTIIGDIRDIGLLKHVFSTYKPHIVFHAAAHKHVPLMEENPTTAVKNNVIGSRNLIYAAHHYKCERFVLISTDKAVNPTSVMGATKRIAEMILQAKAAVSKTKFMAVRFGNVLGSTGSVIPLFKKQIEEGGPVTVTHPEVRRYFMSIKEACILVLQAGAFGKGGEIFVLDMGEQIKIIDLARNLIALSGLIPGKDIEIKFTGLRPGEKLYEEILLDKEKTTVTKHNMIFISQMDKFDLKKLHSNIDSLIRLAETNQSQKIIEKIKEIIPEYKEKAHALPDNQSREFKQ